MNTKAWLSMIQHKILALVPKTAIQLVKNELKCTGVVYNTLISRFCDDGKTKSKWEQELGLEIDDKLWSCMYQKLKKLMLCMKLRYFQF